jgi:hypothetical protein
MPESECGRKNAEKALFTRNEGNRREQRERLTKHGRPQYVVVPQNTEGREIKNTIPGEFTPFSAVNATAEIEGHNSS